MKYKLGNKHPSENLYRCVAIKNFGNIKEGDVGGYIESEANLSQAGNSWVSGEAWVYGEARVSGDACVSGNARVSGEAWVYGEARVSGEARVRGKLNIDYNPINIIGMKYNITIFREHIQAGCYLKTIKEWEAITTFEDQEFFDTCKDKILALACYFD